MHEFLLVTESARFFSECCCYDEAWQVEPEPLGDGSINSCPTQRDMLDRYRHPRNDTYGITAIPGGLQPDNLGYSGRLAFVALMTSC